MRHKKKYTESDYLELKKLIEQFDEDDKIPIRRMPDKTERLLSTIIIVWCPIIILVGYLVGIVYLCFNYFA